MMYYVPQWDFGYEKRGRMFYAFCDKGCPVIRCHDKYALNRAMEQHCLRHEGQLTLDVFPRPEPLPPGSPAPF